MSRFVYTEVSSQTNGQRCHSRMSAFSHEEKRMVQAGMESRQEKTQGENISKSIFFLSVLECTWFVGRCFARQYEAYLFIT